MSGQVNAALEGLGAVVTGGAGDIGVAIGMELLRRGARVTLIDRKTELEAGRWRDRRQLEEVLRSVDQLDVAIGNAGIVESAPFLEITEEQWQTHLDVNLTG